MPEAEVKKVLRLLEAAAKAALSPLGNEAATKPLIYTAANSAQC